MRIGLCLTSLGDWPIDDALKFCREHEIHLVDLPLDSNLALLRDYSLDDVRELKRALAAADVEVRSVSNSRDCQLILGPHGPETDGILDGGPGDKRRYGMAKARQAAGVAAQLGARSVQVAPGCTSYARWFSWPGSSLGWDDNVSDAINALTELAREVPQGPRLIIEPQPKQAVYDALTAQQALGRLAAAGINIGLCYDAANIKAIGEDPVRFLDDVGVIPDLVHAKDIEFMPPRRTSARGGGWTQYGPQRPVRFRIIGWGVLDWEHILSALRESGYDDDILVEHQDVLSRREDGILSSVRYLRDRNILQRAEKRWW